jgi:hypothetical protein
MDLLLLSILAIAAEALGIWLHGKFPFAGYYISFSTMVAIIALLRWGTFGAVVNCLIAIPAAILSKSVSIPLFLFYFISNSGVMIVPKLFKHLETSLIVAKSYWLLGYIISFYGVLTISRGLLGFIVGLTFSDAVMQTIMQLLFIMIISYIVLVLLKNREGLLVDMKAYFINEQKEMEE